MTFTSLPFVVFAAVFFPLYFATRGRVRMFVCLAASYVFYGWWDWRFLSLIMLSTAVDFVVARALERSENDGRRHGLLMVSVVTNLGLLGAFKYFDFFAESFRDVALAFEFEPSIVTLDLVLPVGISFYTFQTMSYTIDVYRRHCEVEHDPVRFAAYVALFPQLVAGPIVRAHHLLPQMRHDQPFDARRIARGLELIAWGFFLKLCVADRLAGVVDPAFDNPEAFGGGAHLLATVAFAFQIYGDFAGYSLIAIGLGRVMGFDFSVNFRRPYFAQSFSEFWQRWHISLSTWLRDYLYVPLGGNKGGGLRTFRNLVVVMFLGGLWHGAAWTFVVWGLLHGIYLVAQRIVGALPLTAVPAVAKIAVVFALTNVAWVFFRANDIGDATTILGRILSADGYWQGAGHNLFELVVGYAMVAAVLIVDILAERPGITERYLAATWVRVLGVATIVWTIALLGVFEGTTFIYFQF